MKRPSIGRVIQQSAQNLLSGGIRTLLEDNREELLQLMKTAQEERGAALLHDICNRIPIAAGFVQLAMGGDAVTAIGAIENFDPQLAVELRKNIGSFRKLQAAYNRGASTS